MSKIKLNSKTYIPLGSATRLHPYVQLPRPPKAPCFWFSASLRSILLCCFPTCQLDCGRHDSWIPGRTHTFLQVFSAGVSFKIDDFDQKINKVGSWPWISLIKKSTSPLVPRSLQTYIYLYWKLTKSLMEETVTGVREHAQAPTCRHIHICMVYGEDGKLTTNCLIWMQDMSAHLTS